MTGPLDLAAEAAHNRRQAARCYRIARQQETATYGDPARHAEQAAQYRKWARESNARARRYDQMVAERDAAIAAYLTINETEGTEHQ